MRLGDTALLKPYGFQVTILEGAPPWIVYAYKKTGRILLEERREFYAADVVAEYDAAIEEYFELERTGKLSKN